MKRLFGLVLVLLFTQPVYADKGDSFLGTEAIGTVNGSPNLYYQIGLDPQRALQFQVLSSAGTTWLYGGYRYYYTQHEDGLYVQGDLGLGTRLDVILSTGIEFRQDGYLVDPHLRLANGKLVVGLNFGYNF